MPRRFTPILMGVREEAVEGSYTLVLEFAKRKEMPAEDFTSRVDKFQSFFGPGVIADMKETEQARLLCISLDCRFMPTGCPQERWPFLLTVITSLTPCP